MAAGLLLTTLAACLGSTLLLRAAAHQCSDGGRVRCIDVIAKPGSPSTNGQGFGARGSAHCTPSGEKLFCLVNHDYHHCYGDQLPCCGDGSDPTHGHSSSSSSSADAALVCGAPKPAEPTSPPPEPTSPVPDALLAEMNALSGPVAESSVLMKGSLTLSVSLKSQVSGSSADISQILKMSESAAVRVGLASHLGVTLSAVKVICLKLIARRRLLDVLDGPQKFQISFSAEMPEGLVEKSQSRPLALDLKEALDAAKSGLAVESASLEWNTADATATGGGSCAFVYIILGVCGASVAMGGLVMVYLRMRWRKAAAAQPTLTEAVEAKAETQDKDEEASNAPSDAKLGKATAETQDKDEEASNAPSTQDPSEGDENRSLGSQASPEVEEAPEEEKELKK